MGNDEGRKPMYETAACGVGVTMFGWGERKIRL